MLLGTHLEPKTYDYAGAVLFNARASMLLWARSTSCLRREIAARLGLTQKAARAVWCVSFAKVAAYQKRGLVQFHVVIRLDGSEGSTQPPSPFAMVTMLAGAIRVTTARVSASVISDAVGEDLDFDASTATILRTLQRTNKAA